MANRPGQADFVVGNEGTIWTIRPLNPKAKEWLEENVVADEWQWFGQALCVDHRYAPPLLIGIQQHGFRLAR